MNDTMLIIAGAEVMLLAGFIVGQWIRHSRDERDKKKLARWMAQRENRLSRERFWQ